MFSNYSDETTDVTARSQLVIIVRYIRDGEPVERFGAT
jgi:hypothetical protein